MRWAAQHLRRNQTYEAPDSPMDTGDGAGEELDGPELLRRAIRNLGPQQRIKVEHEFEKLTRAQRENRILAGEVVPRQQVRAEIVHLLVELRGTLLAEPRQVVDDLETRGLLSADVKEEAERVLQDRLESALAVLADGLGHAASRDHTR